jgi:hypothetical protein
MRFFVSVLGKPSADVVTLPNQHIGTWPIINLSIILFSELSVGPSQSILKPVTFSCKRRCEPLLLQKQAVSWNSVKKARVWYVAPVHIKSGIPFPNRQINPTEM